MDVDTPYMDIWLDHVKHTDSIVLGYEVGTTKLPHDRTMRVVASGKTVRFTIEGIDGYVDLDLNPIAKRAAMLLTGEEL
jgi:hypothetical protein